MYREVCATILPRRRLATTLGAWAQIARGLAESKRNRTRYGFR